MAGYSRKLLRDGVERLIQKGAGKIGSDDLKLSDLVRNLAKSARTTTVATESHLEDVKDRAKNVGETVLNIAKSVDSFGELEQRFKARRGDIVDAAKTFSEQLREVLVHLAEPITPKDKDEAGSRSELAGSANDDDETIAQPRDDES